MLIAIIGTRCSGKRTAESALVAQGFVPIRLYADDEYDRESDYSLTYEDETIETPGNDLVFNHHLSFLSMDPPSARNSIQSITVTRSTSIIFGSTDEMLDYVTRNWRTHFVTTSLNTRETVLPFAKRPFFMLINVDAPLMTRFLRSASTSLEEFVHEDDRIVFGDEGMGSSPTLQGMRDLVHVSINNVFPGTSDLQAHIADLDLTDPKHLRPNWDTYFMTLASLAAQRSNCMKRRVGAIVVRDNRVVATGYNGTPRHLKNCNDGGCSHCNRTAPVSEEKSVDLCLCLHAEENALLEAGRERVNESVLYCNTCPCLKCTVKIIQSGVKTVVYNLSYKVDAASAALFKEAGVELRHHPPSTMLNRHFY
ncbi:hypothetical protein CYLTODRAFT_397583 [Cylindrobasidium torrendii FP15055 ss-10]|uniref:Deoxycytidylate deaminase n=1 Tax=Cylindrobasidium torrendii FP15055 ss-10 TaxID=1314674 RepID=A0A0D7B9L3_9AGAR|nr:hypothetical protein CYLTODRAFT_397583 [Cylindrobasidium torrendii FP15055 ss-10]